MTSESRMMLAALRDALVAKDNGILGQFEFDVESLWVLDRRVRLTAEVLRSETDHPSIAHVHVVAELDGNAKRQINACAVGINDKRNEAICDAAACWVDIAAGPVFSLVLDQPVLGARKFTGREAWGVAGCHGFVGPKRFAIGTESPLNLDIAGDVPLFRYCSEVAPAGLLHSAQVTVEADGNGKWKRTCEIDGHAAAFVERPWVDGPPAPQRAIVSGFAVFHYEDDPDFVSARKKLDDAIRDFVVACESVATIDAASESLIRSGHDAGVAHQVLQFAPLAFCRAMLESLGISSAEEFVRVAANGEIQIGLRLMAEPAFARSQAMARDLLVGDLSDVTRRIAMCSSEFNAINAAMNDGSAAEDLVVLPSVVSEPGAPAEAVRRAYLELQERSRRATLASGKSAKPWQRIWNRFFSRFVRGK